MAKKKRSISKISGTLDDVTHVESEVYGPHVRSRRGTFTEVKLNDGMTQSKDELVVANVPAKMIKDALNPYRENFKDGRLWNRLTVHFKQEIKQNQYIDFRTLEGLEIHGKHSLGSVAGVRVAVVSDVARAVVDIDLEVSRVSFNGLEYIDGFGTTVICVYPNLPAKFAATESCVLPLRPVNKEVFRTQHTLPMPPETSTILVCVKIEGYMKGIISNNLRAQGMKIVKGMDVTRAEV